MDRPSHDARNPPTHRLLRRVRIRTRAETRRKRKRRRMKKTNNKRTSNEKRMIRKRSKKKTSLVSQLKARSLLKSKHPNHHRGYLSANLLVMLPKSMLLKYSVHMVLLKIAKCHVIQIIRNLIK